MNKESIPEDTASSFVEKAAEVLLEAQPDEISPEETTFPEGGARAWLVVLGASGVLFSTFGYANAFGVYQEYYQTHLLSDQTPSAISWIGSFQVFFILAAGLVGGPLFDRYGEKVIWPPAAAYIFSVMMTSVCKTLWQFLLCQGLLGGVAMGMLMGPSIAATGQYFNKKRAAAMGAAVAGSSLGGVILPIALSRMLNNPNLGFGWSVRICGFLMLALLSIAMFGIKARLPPRNGRFFLLEAFKEPLFNAIVGSIFLMILGMFVPFFYIPSYAVEHGMSFQLSAYLPAILNGASFFGRVIPGILADKLGRLNILAAAGLSSGILIFCWTKTTTNATIILFAALYGFCSGAIVSLMSACYAMVSKDPRDIGTYMGMGMAVDSIAALIGPPISGAFVARYHSFDQASYFCGVVVVLGGVGIVLTKLTTEKGIFGKT